MIEYLCSLFNTEVFTVKRIVFLMILVIVSLASASRSTAQDTKPTCDPGAVIDKAAALKSSGNQKKDIAALLALRDEISSADIACNGMTFSGEGTRILGPVVLKKGLYKITVTTKGNFKLYDLSMSGSTCKANITTSLIDEFRPDTEYKAESVENISSEDCKLIFQTGGSGLPWTITFEPLQ
jgi:hypothetical protein